MLRKGCKPQFAGINPQGRRDWAGASALLYHQLSQATRTGLCPRKVHLLRMRLQSLDSRLENWPKLCKCPHKPPYHVWQAQEGVAKLKCPACCGQPYSFQASQAHTNKGKPKAGFNNANARPRPAVCSTASFSKATSFASFPCTLNSVS